MQLFVFHRTLPLDSEAIRAGIDGVIVDLEKKNKIERQSGFDTQINQHSINDIINLKKLDPSIYIICRTESISNTNKNEIQAIIDAGADEILIPMVKKRHEINTALSWLSNQIPLSIMLETKDILQEISALPFVHIKRAYIGLNDLHISRETSSLFDAFTDGTVDKIFAQVNGRTQLGVAGITVPSGGYPIPAKYLMSELLRLTADFTFLRRSYFKDTVSISQEEAINAIKTCLDSMPVNSVEDLSKYLKKESR